MPQRLAKDQSNAAAPGKPARLAAMEVSGAARKCIATGEVRDKSELLRFVVAPEGNLVPDILERLPGRGIWITPTQRNLDAALAKGAFHRAAKTRLQIDPGLASLIEILLVQRTISLISLARKSGKAVAGYEKVKDWLNKENASVLLQASDGSARGKSKLSTPYRGHFIGWLCNAELGLAFGRETVIHGALAPGSLTDRVVREAQRLKGLRQMAVETAARKDK